MPTKTATIEIGIGLNLSDMDKMEKLVENMKFIRIWSEAPKGQRSPRFERDGVTFSIFESELERGIGVGIHLRKSDGLLQVKFSERDTSFSERGRQSLKRLVNAIRNEYGSDLVVTE